MKLNIAISVFILSISIVKQVSSQSLSINSDSINICQEGIDLFNNYQYDKAVDVLKLCYQNDEDNINCLQKIANCNYKLGRFKEAISNYFKILEYDSTNIPAINQLGVIYSKESQYKKSIEQYRKLIELDSANSFYHKQIGHLLLKLSNIENAIQYFENAQKINHQDITVIIELSNIYREIRLHTKAFNPEGIVFV